MSNDSSSPRTADLCDAAGGEVQLLEQMLVHYGGRRRFHGPVECIQVFEDNGLVRRLLQEPGNGRVLVVDGGSSRRVALVGDRMAQLAIDSGWAGVVVNGCVRDSEVLASMPLGVMALGTCPMPPSNGGEGKSSQPVTLAGARIVPGHYLYADWDGVLLSQEQLLQE